MKLAFFSSIATDGHPTSGYEIANEAIVEGLRELGHEVHVFGFRLPRQKQTMAGNVHLLDTVNLENAAATSLQKLRWITAAFVRGLPVAAAKLPAHRQDELLQMVKKAGPFDGHILNSYQMAAAFPQLLAAPCVYVAHNVEHRSAAENAQNAGKLSERLLYQREERVLRKLEARLCDAALHVWTFSEDDLRDHGIGTEKGSFLPLTTPVVGARDPGRKIDFDAGLIGTWSWQPNLVGLNWFLREVVPHLPGDFTVAVAGTAPPGMAAEYPAVRFLGRVESADAFLNSVRLVPLVSRGGTGVQLKTIEALQAGHACVATASSLRGINQIPANCLMADDAGDFAAALIELKIKSENGDLPTVDGADFYRAQHAALLTGLRLGLASLQQSSTDMCAN